MRVGSGRRHPAGNEPDIDHTDSLAGVEPALDARLLPAALCCWGATIVALTGGWVVGLALAVALVVLAIGLWVLLLWAMAHRAERRRVVAVVALAAVLLGAGFAVAGVWREHRVATHPLRSAIGAASVWVTVTPRDDPKPLRGTSFGGERRWIVRADLREFRRGETTVHAGGLVVILASGADWATLLPGQSVEFRARVDKPLYRDLTVASLRALGQPELAGPLPWWQRAAGSVRADFAASASNALPVDSAGLLPALVLGDTSALPDHVRDEFQVAGLQHLCVVSGANFTILLTFVLFIARFLTLGPRFAATVAAAVLLMFIVIARPDPSVLRAGAMGAITLLALITGRRKQALPALCATVIGLLASWPELAVQAGFALSVLATAGLILLAPSWADWLRARGWWRLPAEIVAVSAGAFVVTTPLMIALTGRLSVVAIIANVLVAPVIAPLTIIGATGALLSCVWSPPAELVLRCVGPPMWWLLSVADRAAALPGASIEVPGGMGGGFVACVIVVAGVWLLRSALVRTLTAAVLLGISAVLIPIRIWHPWWPPPGWVLAVCDVGQGDGLALSVGDGTAVVIDVGPDPRAIRTCLNRLRINRIALLVLTHPHADHIDGLTGAVEGRAVSASAVAPGELPATSTASEGAIMNPPGSSNPALARMPNSAGLEENLGESDGPELSKGPTTDPPVPTRGPRAPVSGPAQVAAVVARAGIPVIELSAGHELHFGAVKLEVLAPDSGARHPLGTEDANDRSIVIAATTPAGRILLTGDIEASAQQRLLRTANVEADILKVPHHGSRTTTKEFLAAVRPRLALVSAGADNTFGHPHPGVLAELAALGTRVTRTDQYGDVLVVGDHGRLQTLTLRSAR